MVVAFGSNNFCIQRFYVAAYSPNCVRNERISKFFLLLELEVSVATLVIYELFCVFRDHYLLLTFDIPGWLGSLKIIFLDAGLPMLIIGSFVFSIKIFLSWNTSNSGNESVANSTLAQWLSTLAMTFFMQTLWCICYFMWLYCRSGKVKLSVSYLITSEDSPIFLTNDGTGQESTYRKLMVKKGFLSRCST